MASRSAFFRQFMETLPIKDKHSPRIIPFRLNEAQEWVWTTQLAPKIDAREPINLLALKARRLGISTLIQALLTTRVIWENHITAKVVAHQVESTRFIWDMAERMIQGTPFTAYRDKVGHTMRLGQSHYSCTTAGSPHATRSMHINALHASEIAFWPYPEAWLAMLQTVPLSGEPWVFGESSANGRLHNGQLFYDEWQRAVSGTSTFTPLFLPWFQLQENCLPAWRYAEDAAHEGLVMETLDEDERELRAQFHLTAGQLAWRREIIKGKCRGKIEEFHQEYPSTPEEAFIQTGLPLFPPSKFYYLRPHVRKGRTFRLEGSGRFVTDTEGYVEIWQAPEAGHQYVIGADTSLGFADGQHSRSAAEIFDMTTMEQVGEYDCASAPHVMAKHLAILGRRYNDALLCPEINASGGGGGRELLVYLMKEHHYYHLHRRKQVDVVQVDPGRLWGWETTSRTRPRMIARLREAIDEQTMILHSEKLLSQLRAFGESDDGRLCALAGKDDLLFACGIALMSRSENHYAVPEAEPARMTKEHLVASGLSLKPDLDQAESEEWAEHGAGPTPVSYLTL